MSIGPVDGGWEVSVPPSSLENYHLPWIEMNIFFVNDVAEKREWIDNKNSVAESVAVGHGAVYFFNSHPSLLPYA